MMHKVKTKQSGFTIVELMISTVVFSIVLLVASYGIIAVGRAYYKSLTSNRVHETVRSVMSDISASLQFADTNSVASQLSDPAGTQVKVRCFGSDRYRYVLNQPVSGSNHAFYRDKRPSDATCNNCSAAGVNASGQCISVAPFTGGQELLGDNMRLLQFDVDGTGPFGVHLKVAYGDSDLLTIYDDNGNPKGGWHNPPTSTSDQNTVAGALCKAIFTGSVFCATAGLDTTVTSRVK